MKDAIGYLRASTPEQGRSGLGLAAQHHDIEAFGAREGSQSNPRTKMSKPAVCTHSMPPNYSCLSTAIATPANHLSRSFCNSCRSLTGYRAITDSCQAINSSRSTTVHLVLVILHRPDGRQPET